MKRSVLLLAIVLAQLWVMTVGRAESPETASNAPHPGLVIVYDASRSMWAHMPAFGSTLDPEARRYAIAADFSRGLVDRIAAAAPGYDAGLYLFGANRPGDCSDRGLAVDFKPLSDPHQRSLIKDAMSNAAPTGITPIAASVEEAARLLKGYSPALIILVTDGAEECPEVGKDPCEAAATAKQAAPALIVHVVGLALPDEILKRISCIADRTGGQVDVITAPVDKDRIVAALTAAIVPPPRKTIIARADVAPATTFPAIRQLPTISLVEDGTGRTVATSATGSLSERVSEGSYKVEFRLGTAMRSTRLETAGIDGEANVALTFPFGILKVEPTLPDGRQFEGEPKIVWTLELVGTADGRTFPPGSQVVVYQAPSLRLAVPPGSYRVTAGFNDRNWGGDEPPIAVASGAEAVRSIEMN